VILKNVHFLIEEPEKNAKKQGNFGGGPLKQCINEGCYGRTLSKYYECTEKE
jgi:hypothetical protein